MPIVTKTQTDLQRLCTAQQWRQVQRFVKLLLEYNRRVNLISRHDTAAVYDHHVAPSFLYVMTQRLAAGKTILDIGSGGGFPGIINAILLPEQQHVLVDSTRKKVTWLETAIAELQLTHTQALWARVEQLAAAKRWQHYFDHTTSRAVAPLKMLVRWSKPLLKPGGTVEALKGNNVAAELKHVVQPYTIHGAPSDWQWHEYLRRSCIVSVQL